MCGGLWISVKNPVSDDLMKRYLLGDVSDEQQVRLEAEYFVDDSVFEQLSALEDELIDDYVRGELAEPQRRQFELHFLNSVERQRKLAFAESFAQYLSSVPAAGAAEKRETSQQRIADWLGLRGAGARWAFAAVFVVVVFGGAGLAWENWQLRTQLMEIQAQQTVLRQQEEQLSKQLAQLKALAIEGTPQSTPVAEGTQSQPHPFPIVAVILAPGLVRSSAEQKTLIIPPGAHLVRLRLDLENQPYESYLATLETAEGRRVWSKEGLKATPEGGVRMVVLDLPSSLLGNNDYILKLRGLRSGAAPTNQYHPGEVQNLIVEDVAAYSFRVVKH